MRFLWTDVSNMLTMLDFINPVCPISRGLKNALQDVSLSQRSEAEGMILLVWRPLHTTVLCAFKISHEWRIASPRHSTDRHIDIILGVDSTMPEMFQREKKISAVFA